MFVSSARNKSQEVWHQTIRGYYGDLTLCPVIGCSALWRTLLIFLIENIQVTFRKSVPLYQKEYISTNHFPDF